MILDGERVQLDDGTRGVVQWRTVFLAVRLDDGTTVTVDEADAEVVR